MLVFLSLLTAMALGIASAFMGAVALGATALIVPGTGTPNANIVDDYLDNAWDRYIDGVVCTVADECDNPDLVGINYPASFWPVSFIPGWCVAGRCEKWNVSVGEGTDNLIEALTPFLDEASTEAVYLMGYSQGGAVIANTLAYLDTRELPESVKDRLKVVTIGGIENPDGGLWQRLAWLRFLLGDPIPILDLSFEPGMAVDTGIASTTIGFKYDPVVYAPRYWGNLLAVLNMIAAFDTVHGYYLSPNGNDETATLPYGYTPGTLAPQLNCDLNPANCRTDSYGNTYIMVPATSLPLTNLIRSLADSIGIGKLAKPFIDLWEPILTVMVDLGFDWSGDPGVTRSSTILPFKIFQNWFKVGVDLAVATVKGIEAFLGNFGIDSAATRLRVAQDTEFAPLSAAADPAETGKSATAEDETTEAGGTPQDDGAVPSEEVEEADATEDVVAEEADATEDVVAEDEVVTEVGEEAAEDVTQEEEVVTQEAAEDVTQEEEVVTQEDEVTDADATDADDSDDAADTDTDTASDDGAEGETRAAA